MRYAKLFSFVLLFLTSSTYALNPVDGWYTGIMIEGSYATKTNYWFVDPNTTDTNSVKGTMYYSGAGGGALFFGYKYNMLRVEIEPFGNYNPYHKLQIGSTTYTSPKQTTGVKIDGSTTSFMAFINGYIDLFVPRNEPNGAFAYIGLGAGWASVNNKLRFYNNNTVTTRQSSTAQAGAAQGIIGAGYYLDDYTWFGLDYRYIATSRIETFGSRLQLNTINITFAGSICAF